MQKAVWAADVIIKCGAREMSWASLLRGSLYILQALRTVPTNLTEHTLYEFGFIQFISEMISIRARRIGSLPLSLQQVLARVRVRKSSNPRDKIFGILNLLPLMSGPAHQIVRKMPRKSFPRLPSA